MNLRFDPFDPAQTQNQCEALRELRRSAPVSRPRDGLVYVARYHDVKAVFRDESVYSDPERWPGAPELLSFGPGPHLCLGNQLARMEARVALETVMDLLPARALQLAPGHTLELVPMFLEYGPERLDASVAL